MAKPIECIQRGTNSELVATAAQLYPLDGYVLDLTPGDALGFWTKVQPANLHVLRTGDFRDVRAGSPPAHIAPRDGAVSPARPHDDAMWDAITFDPPYVTKGGHATSTTHDMNARYGMLHVERNPPLQWQRQIVPGFREVYRLLAPGGRGWIKVMDYVTGGKVHWFTKLALPALTEIGFQLEDELILHGHPGPQPGDRTRICPGCRGTGTVKPRQDDRPCLICNGAKRVASRQQHARRSHSVLLIARKKAVRRRAAK